MTPVVFIIGVGPGLGESLARTFYKASYKVGLIARSTKRLNSISESIPGTDIAFEACDCTDYNKFGAAIEKLSKTLGKPSVCIYNAAALTADNILTMDPADLLYRLNINLVATLVMVQTVLPMFSSLTTGGHFLFTGGILAHKPNPEMSSLSLGKQGLLTLSSMLAEELNQKNICCTYMNITTRIGEEGTPPEVIATKYLDVVKNKLTGEILVP